MSLEVAAPLLLGGLIFLLFIGTEIFAAIAVMAIIGLVFVVGQPLSQFAFTAFKVMNSFTLTAMPLFVFMGTIFFATGIVSKLFTAADKIFGGLPGGVACSVLGGCGIFGAMSGSSLAAAATFGKIAYPEMERLNYDPKLALGSIAIGGTLSVLIPPSIILIVYAGWQEVSVARLFAAAIIPGILLTSLLILTVIILVRINPKLAPRPPKILWKDRFRAFVDLAPFAIVIVLVLGVIFGGVMTPTESAAMGGILSVILALVYHRMSFAALKEAMWTAVKLNAMIGFLIVTARVLAQVFHYMGITNAFEAMMMDSEIGRFGILAIVCLVYIILGMFFDGFSMLVLTLPFVGPLIESLGFNLIWFGVTFVILAEIGMVTPPFGLNLFILRGVVPKFEITTIAMGALPFLIPAIVVICVLIVFPDVAMWLPNVLY